MFSLCVVCSSSRTKRQMPQAVSQHLRCVKHTHDEAINRIIALWIKKNTSYFVGWL